MLSKIIPTHIYKVVFYGSIATFIFSIFSTGWYHPDEHYQIMEYANVFLTDNSSTSFLPWEYIKEMRSGIQPFIVYILGRALDLMGVYNPFVLAMITRMIAALLSIIAVITLWHGIKDTLKNHTWDKIYILISFFFWITAYHHVRFSSENISGALLTICVGLYLIYKNRNTKWRVTQGIWIGFLSGLSFVVRYQCGIALAGILLYMIIIKKEYRYILYCTIGACMAIGVGVCIDYWLYGRWTFTLYNYVYENIIAGYSEYFGTYNIVEYLIKILQDGMYIFSLIILFSWMFFIWKNPRNIITWATVPFIVLHFIIPHKETRFLFPLLGFVPYMMTYTAMHIWKNSYYQGFIRLSTRILLIINIACIAFFSLKGDTAIRYYRELYNMCMNEKCNVSIITTSKESFAYHYHEDILYNREIYCHYYMPCGIKRYHTHDISLAVEIAKKEHKKGKSVFILSSKQNLSVNLPFKKVHFLPYPSWVIKYFNINDWVSRSSGMNEYIYVLKNESIL